MTGRTLRCTPALAQRMALHRVPRCDGWRHVASESAHAAHGRGDSLVHEHQLEGRHGATATQDGLLACVD